LLDPLFREKEDLLSIVTLAAGLVPMPGLLVFVAQPTLFERLDTIRLLIILSAIGFGVLFVSMMTVFALHYVSVRGALRRHVIRDAPATPIAKDWTLLQQAAAVSNIIFLALTGWSYWHPIRLGATLAAIVGALLVVFVLSSSPLADFLAERRARPR
jgi:hypothetical protein